MRKSMMHFTKVIFLLAFISILASCSSRRPAVKTTAAAANMANAMANLKANSSIVSLQIGQE